MDLVLLLLGIAVLVVFNYNNKVGVIIGAIILLVLSEYNIKTEKIGNSVEIKCTKDCEKDVNDKLVCKSECIKNLKEILK
jgi:hypothetical protein